MMVEFVPRDEVGRFDAVAATVNMLAKIMHTNCENNLRRN